MNDADGSERVQVALNRYSSFRESSKKVSKPHLNPVVLDRDWQPFYLKGLSHTSSVRMHSGETAEVLDLKNRFANSRFAIYSKLVSNFYDPDCGCEGTEN
jgi:hypothetical protein